jgi:two-component system LytT family response regulator
LAKILIVDDDPNITFTFKMVLEKQGYDVDDFTDPVKAFSRFREGLYNVALIDIRMPNMSGLELYQKLRKKDDKIRVCFITAFEISKEEFGEPRSDKGAIFLKKPIGNAELIKQVQALISS